MNETMENDEEFKVDLNDQDDAEDQEDMDEELLNEDADELIVETIIKRSRSKPLKYNPDEQTHHKLPENVFIDNLPKDKQGINKMAMEVNNNIRRLEIAFFEEEDSDNDMFFEKTLKDESICSQEHNKTLGKLKERSHITQYYCIPLSINVMDLISGPEYEESGEKTIKIDNFVDTQMKLGGRMFDVITCDPPW